jgi:MgtC family
MVSLYAKRYSAPPRRSHPPPTQSSELFDHSGSAWLARAPMRSLPQGPRPSSCADYCSTMIPRLEAVSSLTSSREWAFLAQGSSLIKDGANVRGLNTAATIWCSAAIGALCGLGALHLALVLAAGVLLTNMVLRPLAYRLHPVLPEAIPAETLYELKLNCKVSAAAHIRALLLSTITPLPVTLHSIHGEQNDANEKTHIRAEVTTAGRNNEAVEQVVMRLLFEDDVSTLSWSIIESTME